MLNEKQFSDSENIYNNTFHFIILLVGVFVFFSNYCTADTWTTLDFPGASATYAYGIDNGKIVGQYYDNSGGHMFLYDNSNWTTLVMPDVEDATVSGIDGDNIVGRFTDTSGSHGFLYNGTTWTTLDMPGAEATNAAGIDGDNIVGGYTDAFGNHGFLYDGTTWSNPITQFQIKDIDGANMVATNGAVSNFFDGSEWNQLSMPGALSLIALGIDGSNIVGTCYLGSSYHGFLYDGTNWSILDAPSASYTSIHGIDGDKIVGEYYDDSGYHGFVYEIPEPATVVLLGLGGLLIRQKK